MSFVSQSVITGFVNALAILIFHGYQLPELTNVGTEVYVLTALGAWNYLFISLCSQNWKSNSIPTSCIITLTVITQYFGINIRTVGDMGTRPSTLPVFHLPNIPFTLETLFIILPYSAAMAIVGLLESLMTATIVDELTDTTSNSNKECKGQGIANIVVGLFGGMAGCAMIGQSIINVKSGGRNRLSTLIAGGLIVMVVFLSQYLKIIPMAALVAVMIMVSIGTFNWGSIKNLKDYPLTTNIVMITTVAVVVITHNLAFGVFAGVLLASLFFANKMSNSMNISSEVIDDERKYKVTGQVFFNSSEQFLKNFDFKENVSKVSIDFSNAQFWDVSAVTALDKVVIKFKQNKIDVNIIGLNQESQSIIDKFGISNDPNKSEQLLSAH